MRFRTWQRFQGREWRSAGRGRLRWSVRQNSSVMSPWLGSERAKDDRNPRATLPVHPHRDIRDWARVV